MIGYDSYFKIENKQLCLINKKGEKEEIVINDKKILFKTDQYNKFQKKIIKAFINRFIYLNRDESFSVYDLPDIAFPAINFEELTLAMCYDVDEVKIEHEFTSENPEGKTKAIVKPLSWFSEFLKPILFTRSENESYHKFTERVSEFIGESTNL